MVPPKLVKPPPPKSKGISKQPTKGKLLKGKGKIEIPPPEEEAPPPPEPEKPPKPLWTTTIKIIPVEDAQLHKELSMKRREKDKQKHMEFCDEVLGDILAFAFQSINNPDPKAVRRARIQFHSTDFPIDRPQTTLSIRPNNAATIPKTRSSFFSPPPPQKMYAIPYQQALQNLLKIVSNDKLHYDENSEIDQLLQKCVEQSEIYKKPTPQPEKSNFPFVICISGGNCSGKTTIAQYLQSFLKVQIIEFNTTETVLQSTEKFHIISETDDKVNLQTITNFHQNLEEGEGLILVNYPQNKPQIGQLEKVLLARGSKTLGGIAAFIKTDFNSDQEQEALKQRIYDKKTGQILGKTFFPPDFFSESYVNELELSDFPVDANSKPNSGSGNLEKSFKKVTQILNVGYLPFVTELYSMLNDLLKKIVENRPSVEIKLPDFKFKTTKDYLYMKFCNDFLEHWTKNLVPLFGKELGSKYSDLSSLNRHITNVMSITRDRFNLKINVKDERETIQDKFMRGEITNSQYFNDIWDLANTNRNKQTEESEKIIQSVGLNAAKALTNEDAEFVFKSLLNRFQVIMYISREFKSYLLEPTETPPAISTPEITNIEELDFKSAAKILYIDVDGSGSVELPDFLVQKQKKRPQPLICTPIGGAKIMTPGVPQTKSKLAQHGPMTYSTVVKPKMSKDAVGSSTWDVPTELNTILSKSQSDFRDMDEETSETDTLINSIVEFLQICVTKANSEPQKKEIEVLSLIFNQFVAEKNNIDHLVKQGKAILLKEFTDIITRKHQHEMEHFSADFLKYQDNPRCPKPIFEYDHSLLSDHLKALSDIAGGIPNPDFPSHLTHSKMENLYEYSDKTKVYIGLDELLSTAKNAGFDECDCAELELIARMTSNPDFIQVGPLCQIIANSPQNAPQPVVSQRPKTSLY